MYLEQAILSVLEQGYPETELIVVDGVSRDGSLEIIHKYSNRLAWWVSEPDHGQSHAINKGLAQCTGDLITFIGGDDYYLPNSLARVSAEYADQPGVGALIGAFGFLENGRASPSVFQSPFLLKSAPVDLSLGPPGIYRLHQVSTFYTRAGLEAAGRFVRENMHYVMDRDLLYRVCRLLPVQLIDAALGVFRRHEQAKSASSTLSFAREFSGLYLSFCNGNPAEDRLRRAMSRYRLARGYLKYAQQTVPAYHSFYYLLKAGWTYPEQLSTLAYWKQFVHRSMD
jgi:glycosyltransferase involved in cell wall biosynthesis